MQNEPIDRSEKASVERNIAGVYHIMIAETIGV
jgi:hypothetical protein